MVLGSIPNIIIFCMLLCYSTFSLIVSAFIDPDTCPWVLYKIVCGTYPIQTYVFAHPTGLRKVVVTVPVGYAYYPSVIDQFFYKR